MTFKIDPVSIYDLSLISSNLVSFGMADPRVNDRVLQYFGTIYLFGLARQSDTTCNLDAVRDLYLLFDRDICIIEHYIDQLAIRFVNTDSVDFLQKVYAISWRVSIVQHLLRKVKMEQISTFAPWRFVFYRLMLQISAIIEQLNMYCFTKVDRTSISRIPLYMKMMYACGGVDFLPELHLLCEIINRLENSIKLCSGSVGAEPYKSLQSLLFEKIQPKKSAQPTERQYKKSQLSKSWSSSSEDEDSEEELSFGDFSKQELPNTLPSVDVSDDVFQTLLSIEPQKVDERLFQDLAFCKAESKPLEETNSENSVVAQPVLEKSADVQVTSLPVVETAIGQVAKWRSPSLEAAKERFKKEQQEKKSPKRYPYRRQKKIHRVAAEVATLIAHEETIPPAVDAKPAELAEQKTPSPKNPSSPAKTSRKKPAQETATPADAEPKKKKKGGFYNKVWMRNN